MQIRQHRKKSSLQIVINRPDTSSDSEDDVSDKKSENTEVIGDEDNELLKFYGLSSLNPKQWQQSNPNDSDEEMIYDEDEFDLLGIITEAPRQTWKTAQKEGGKKINPLAEDFDAKSYLIHMYKDVNLKQLQKGAKSLGVRVAERTEGLKTLVSENLESFISCKDTIDRFDEELKKRSPKTKELEKALNDSLVSGINAFKPILERNEKAEKLRSTINYLDRHRFLFNLPASLRESINKKQFEIAVRDFKRGGQYMQDVKGPAFEKIWNEVLRIVEELRILLERILMESRLPVDAQERLIEHLVELDPGKNDENPARFYLKNQYEMIQNAFKETYEIYLERCSAILQKMKNYQKQEVDHIRRDFLRTVNANLLKTKDFEQYQESIMSNRGVESFLIQIWQEKERVTNKLSMTLATSFPSFWRFLRSLTEGKYSKKGSKQKPILNEKLTQMPLQIFNLFISIISAIFSSSTQSSNLLPPEFGKPTFIDDTLEAKIHPLVKCYFLVRSDESITSCYEVIKNLKLPEEILISISNQLSSAKQQFIEIICLSAHHEMQTFATYEDWVCTFDAPEVTNLPKLFQEFISLVFLSFREIAGEPLPPNKRTQFLGATFFKTLEEFFYDCVFLFVDSLHFNAFATLEEFKSLNITLRPIPKILSGALTDVHNQGIRLLMVLSNLTFTQENLLNNLSNKCHDLFGITPNSSNEKLIEILDHLHNLIFEEYIKSKSLKICYKIEKGILYSGLDWGSVSKPTEIRGYIFELLLDLVLIHAEVFDCFKELAPKLFSELLVTIWLKFLVCLKKVNHFGVGGTLYAILEVEFINQTLLPFETKASKEIFERVSKAIDIQNKMMDQSIQAELESARDILKATKKPTEMQFICFQDVKI